MAKKTEKETKKKLDEKDINKIRDFLNLKNQEKKLKEKIEESKEDILVLLDKYDGKIVLDGNNITSHEAVTYEYSDCIQNIETEIKVLKTREVDNNIAVIKSVTPYVKVYELKSDVSTKKDSN